MSEQLEAQRYETERLKKVIQEVHSANSIQVQALRKEKEQLVATSSQQLQELHQRLQDQAQADRQRTQQLEQEVTSLRAAHTAGGQEVTQASASLSEMRRQLDVLQSELRKERLARQQLHQDFTDYQAAWEEPSYQNEHAPLPPLESRNPGTSFDVGVPTSIPSSVPLVDPSSYFTGFAAPPSVSVSVPLLGQPSGSGGGVPLMSGPYAYAPPVQQNLVFQVTLKPREPKVYSGRVDEDVDTWISTVQGYLRAVGAPPGQQVAFTVT